MHPTKPWPTGFSLPLSQTFWWDIQATKYGWELETWVWGLKTLWDLDLGMWKWIWMRKETYFQVLLRRSSVEEQSHLSKFPDALTVTLILSPPQRLLLVSPSPRDFSIQLSIWFLHLGNYLILSSPKPKLLISSPRSAPCSINHQGKLGLYFYRNLYIYI